MDAESIPYGEDEVEAGTVEVAVRFKSLWRKGLESSVPFFFPDWETASYVTDVEGDVVSVRFTDAPQEDATLRWALLQA